MMEHLVNKNVREIEISGIRKFFNMVADKEDIISLTLGQPDFNTPKHVKIAALLAIEKNKTTYTHNAGFIELRQAASNFIKTKYGLSYNPVDEVIITAGSSEALDITFRTILEEDSEVILPVPIYPGYEPLIKLCGSKPVYVDTTSNGFRLNAQTLAPKITSKTRCVVLPYPSNPTGTTLDRAELEEIAELLSDKDIFVISDELYSELIFSNKQHNSIAHFDSMRDKTIVINGLSKSHAMTGWRVGMAFAPANIAKHMLKVHQYNVTCATSITQWAAYEALLNGSNDATPMRDSYELRIDYVYKRLSAMGLDVVKPNATFYIFPSIKKFNINSFDFALRMVNEAGVAVIPGDAFSSYGEGYIRISCAYSMEVLKAGLSRMEQFIKSL